MAYTYDLGAGPVKRLIDGRLHTTWIVTEGLVTTTDGWVIEVPVHFTISLFEAYVSGGATTIQPEYSLDSAWSTTGFDYIPSPYSAASRIRSGVDLRIYAPNGQLYVRSKPVGGTATTIKSRITLVEGH